MTNNNNNKFDNLKKDLKKEIFNYLKFSDLIKFGLNLNKNTLDIVKNLQYFKDLKENNEIFYELNNNKILDYCLTFEKYHNGKKNITIEIFEYLLTKIYKKFETLNLSNFYLNNVNNFNSLKETLISGKKLKEIIIDEEIFNENINNNNHNNDINFFKEFLTGIKFNNSIKKIIFKGMSNKLIDTYYLELFDIIYLKNNYNKIDIDILGFTLFDHNMDFFSKFCNFIKISKNLKYLNIIYSGEYDQNRKYYLEIFTEALINNNSIERINIFYNYFDDRENFFDNFLPNIVLNMSELISFEINFKYLIKNLSFSKFLDALEKNKSLKILKIEKMYFKEKEYVKNKNIINVFKVNYNLIELSLDISGFEKIALENFIINLTNNLNIRNLILNDIKWDNDILTIFTNFINKNKTLKSLSLLNNNSFFKISNFIDTNKLREFSFSIIKSNLDKIEINTDSILSSDKDIFLEFLKENKLKILNLSNLSNISDNYLFENNSLIWLGQNKSLKELKIVSESIFSDEIIKNIFSYLKNTEITRLIVEKMDFTDNYNENIQNIITYLKKNSYIKYISLKFTSCKNFYEFFKIVLKEECITNKIEKFECMLHSSINFLPEYIDFLVKSIIKYPNINFGCDISKIYEIINYENSIKSLHQTFSYDSNEDEIDEYYEYDSNDNDSYNSSMDIEEEYYFT
jgi:hypothetical protein